MGMQSSSKRESQGQARENKDMKLRSGRSQFSALAFVLGGDAADSLSGDWRPFRALTPAQPRKFLRERREPRPSLRIGFGDCHQYAEASNGLLRPRAMSDHATALLSVVNEFSPSNVDFHVTLPRRVMPAGATSPRFDCVVCGYVMSEDGPITLPLLQPIATASTDESSRVGDAG